MISLAFLLRFLVNIESGRFSHRRLFSEESLGAEREAAQNRTGCGVCAERGRAARAKRQPEVLDSAGEEHGGAGA